jgi:type I restriction enzyme S subunit
MSKYIPAHKYCNSIFDGTHDTPKPCVSGYPLVTSKNILGGELNLDNTYNISEVDYKIIQKRSAVSKWDVLFSMIGSIGETYLERSDNVSYAIKNVGVFSCKDEYKAKWLYYYLISPYSKQFIENYLAGAVQKFLPLGTLRDFPVLPFDGSKKELVNTLVNIDDKIKINNKTNAELEALAKLIYDYWFVQFDFPNENGKPYKSSGGGMIWNEELKSEIPEKWMVKKVADFLDVVTGKEDANFASESGKYAYFTCGKKILKCNEAVFFGKSVLVAGNGSFDVKYYNGRFNAYQRVYVLKPRDANFIGIIYRSVFRNITRFILGSQGSIVKFITKGDVENINILVPDNLELLTQLNIILDITQNNNLESEQLTKLRDWLLPMLMNGQVKINN